MERQELRAGTETGPECAEGESSRRWSDSQELEGPEGGMGKARWCRAERGQSVRAREGKRRCMVGGAKNGALVIQKRAASGERRLMRVRERPAVKECEKATENVHILRIEPLPCEKRICRYTTRAMINAFRGAI